MAASNKVQEMAAVDLGALLDAGDDAFVTLVAGDTRLAAHRAVLAARSPVFAAMFGHDTLESSSGQVVIPDTEGPVLRQLLTYLYTLQAPQLPGMAPQLLAAADKYGVLGLKAQCEQQLVTELAVENAVATAVLAVRHSCTSLRQATLTFIQAHVFDVMATQGWAEAMLNQPKNLLEVSQLLSDRRAEIRAPAATGSRATSTPHQPHCGSPAAAAPPTPPPDEAAVSRMRSLSAEERNRRLIEAAKEGEVGELGALLAAGADVGARDEDEKTALHCAAGGGHEDTARRLLEAGAQLHTMDRWQNRPLHEAAWSGHAAVVRLLLSWSADPNARDDRGRTPLHDAAEEGRAEAAAALLESGADRGATDEDGDTPLDLARQQNHHQMMQLLS